jgi:3-methyladenine DNA glycosylase AlkD
VLRRFAPRAHADLLPTVERLLSTKAWWDTVDELAIHVVGPLVARHGLQADMRRWIDDKDFWLARAAILHQNTYRERTDADLLFEFCRRRAADDEFFLRKAIGWALRQYARIDPDAVLRFVKDDEQALSGLSTREALRHVEV